MTAQKPSALLLDHAQDKIAVLDGEGTFTYVNGAATRILGFDPGELVGENAFAYVHPGDREETRAAFERVIAGGEEFMAETATYRHRAEDGSWVWLESRMSNLTGSGLDGYVVSSREVTDRVQAQREKRETESRLREIANTTDDVLWMFTSDWSELLFVNPAYESVFGRSIEELEGDPGSFMDCIHPDDIEAVRVAMGRLSEGEAVGIEYRVTDGPDRDHALWVQGEPITEDGEVARIVGFARDVTDRHRRERQLAVMDNLLRHNLRNELNIIIGYAEEMADDSGDDRIDVIRRAGDDLLETASKQREIVELLSSPVTPRPVDLTTEVGEAARRVNNRYPDATVETRLPGSAPVRALEEIEFAATELLENAIRHGEGPNRRVSASVTAEDGAVALVVRDDAPPIPAYDRRVLTGEHDMDPVNHSSGCGLWLVYWIVDLSEGSIAVDSAPEGNTITIRLPAASG